MPKKQGAPSRGHKSPTTTSVAGGAKKARWSSEQRVARGRSVERPRGNEAAGERGRDGSPRDAADRRPNWEPRVRSGATTGVRSSRQEHSPRSDRPARGDWSDRPARQDWQDRPARADRSDRPARQDWQERPARVDRSDRPARQDWQERPARADRSDRPARQDWQERPARADRSDRPARGDRPARQGWSERSARTDRPVRSDRPFRDRDRDAARPAGRDEERAPRFVPAPDVVHERLAATAIEASGSAPGFAELGLGQNIVRALAELGAASPFPIQVGTIPAALDGRDVLGRGRTGSGKTIAFGAPLVERLLRLQKDSAERRKPGRAPRALILAPTRELALQIDATIQQLAQSVRLFTTQIYGGVPFARQIGALQRGVDIVIGTPGRIQDLANRGALDLSAVEITVLDEADHMAELGFVEPVQELLRMTRPDGQRLLFSATLDAAVMGLVEEFLVDPSVFEVAGEDQASGTIDHRVLLIDHRDKLEILTELVGASERTIVFSRTRAYAEQLADHLDEQGVDADAIHGDLAQARRQRSLDRFSKGRTAVLVATDVAARGIHVDDVELVVQADAPDEHKSYLHRSGRTGRAGRSGIVVTLVARNRRRRMEELLDRAGITASWTPVRPGEAAAALGALAEAK